MSSAGPTSGVHNVKLVAISVFWGAILLFNTVIALQTLYRWEITQETLRKQDSQHPGLAQIQRETSQALSGYSWVNEEVGIARIPIEEAITRFVDQRQGGKNPAR